MRETAVFGGLPLQGSSRRRGGDLVERPLGVPKAVTPGLRRDVSPTYFEGGSSDLSIPTAFAHGYGRSMSIADVGPRPQAFDLEAETLENPNYRTVAWSGNTCRSP